MENNQVSSSSIKLPENYTIDQFELWYIFNDDKLNKKYGKYLDEKYKLLTVDVKDQYAERVAKSLEQPPERKSEWDNPN